jgi:cytochrome c-type biogenesis protein
VGSAVSGLIVAFFAGVVSFLSPCVLPLIPGYLSFLTGLSRSQLASEDRSVWDVVRPSLLFVAGFSVVFVTLGASASALGTVLASYREPLTRIAGVVIAGMGFLMLGIVKVPWLYGEARLDMSASRRFGAWAGLLMGMAFAFGWTPCVGPILASILALAGSSANVARGAALLLAYSLGLGVPFVAVGLLFGRVDGLMGYMNRHAVVINRVAGVVLIALGTIIAFGRLSWLAALLYRAMPFLRFG